MPDDPKKTPKDPPKSQDPPKDGPGSSPPENDDGFTDPHLKGKSPKEIEELFRMSQQIATNSRARIEAQSKQIEELSKKPDNPPKDPLPKGKPFFDDPDSALESAMERLAKRVEEQIAPLRKEVAEAKGYVTSRNAHENLRAQHSDWDSVWPWIQQLLSQQNYPNPDDEGLLSTLYYTAKGVMLEKGVLPLKRTEGDDPPKDQGGSEGRSDAPPQHRSSPPPPPPKDDKGKKSEVSWDDLDETERTICRMQGMTPAEFVHLRDIEADEVATDTYGKKEA